MKITKGIKWILSILGIIVLIALIAWITWNVKPVETITTTETIYKIDPLDSILADSLGKEADRWYNKWWATKLQLDKLFAKWKELKPDTIIKSDTVETYTIYHEYIVKIEKINKRIVIWTFRIDSLLARGTLEEIKNAIADGVFEPADSVSGTVRKYIYSLPTDCNDYVAVSKPRGLFFEYQKDSPFAFLVGIGTDYIWVNDTFSFEEFKNFGRFGFRLHSQLWYKNRLVFTPIAFDTKKGMYSSLDLILLRFGTIKR